METTAAGSAQPEQSRVLVTGATGYVGARLVTRLLEAGYNVRCAVRTPRKLADRPWRADPRVDIVQCDFEDPASLTAAMQGCGPAYYLVHSMMSAGGAYAEHDLKLARAEAAGRVACSDHEHASEGRGGRRPGGSAGAGLTRPRWRA